MNRSKLSRRKKKKAIRNRKHLYSNELIAGGFTTSRKSSIYRGQYGGMISYDMPPLEAASILAARKGPHHVKKRTWGPETKSNIGPDPMWYWVDQLIMAFIEKGGRGDKLKDIVGPPPGPGARERVQGIIDNLEEKLSDAIASREAAPARFEASRREWENALKAESEAGKTLDEAKAALDEATTALENVEGLVGGAPFRDARASASAWLRRRRVRRHPVVWARTVESKMTMVGM